MCFWWLCVFLCPSVHKPVSLTVRLRWSTHLRVIMKATFDFNLSWNLLLLSQVTIPLFLLLFSCFFSSRSHCHKTNGNSMAVAVQKWHFAKVGQSLVKVTQGLDYNTPFCSNCAFIALWIFTLNPIWITLCKAPLETLKKTLILNNHEHEQKSICGCLDLLRRFFLLIIRPLWIKVCLCASPSKFFLPLGPLAC